ncbi:hypothetical protein PV327_005660 [Microctonus hyperodae]|uniref:Uncharacterized protein n=1 Tax=Microctonus hyperodae TaxID=165561 RepID=A0AA39G252_MICHY|nr:hypothetical protein PV327_005660 [Microctonus hyperodae]
MQKSLDAFYHTYLSSWGIGCLFVYTDHSSSSSSSCVLNSAYVYKDMYNDTIVVRVSDEYVACVAFTKPSAGSFSTITFFFNI